jgi:hypothetical protein
MTQPRFDQAQLKAKQAEWKQAVRLGKRRSREESDSSDAPRDRPTTVNPAELSLSHAPFHHTVAPTAPMGQ